MSHLVTDPDLYALVLRLQPITQRVVKPTGHSVHALFLDLVQQVDPQLSQKLHADALSKHFTTALLPSRRSAHGALEMRMTLLHSDLFRPVTFALLQQTAMPSIHLRGADLTLRDVCGTPGSHPWAGFSSFAVLANQVQPSRLVTLRFETPTVFMQGSGSLGKKNKKKEAVLPQPETVFGSLVQRWNNLAPADLTLDREAIVEACDAVLVRRYDLRTVTHPLRKHPQIGFVGECTYELPEHAQIVLTLLADAAFYLGIGAKTTQGMGMCQRVTEATEQ